MSLFPVLIFFSPFPLSLMDVPLDNFSLKIFSFSFFLFDLQTLSMKPEWRLVSKINMREDALKEGRHQSLVNLPLSWTPKGRPLLSNSGLWKPRTMPRSGALFPSPLDSALLLSLTRALLRTLYWVSHYYSLQCSHSLPSGVEGRQWGRQLHCWCGIFRGKLRKL